MNERVRLLFWSLLNLVLIGVIVVIFAVVIPGARQFLDQVPATRTLSVSAEGKSTMKPDIAQVSFSVISRGQDPAKIATDNNQKITNVINELKKQGIDAKDIKTSSYDLHPVYVYNRTTGKSDIDGFELNQGVELKIRDLSKANTILGLLPGMGVNNISQLNFTIDDMDAVRAEARKEAFEKAREKAGVMAEQAGIKLGRVITANESSDYRPAYYAKAAYDSAMGGAVAESVPAPTLEPGSQEVTVNVSITYAIN